MTDQNIIAGDLVKTLKSNFKGKLIFPEDRDYDEARKIWNGMIDKRPAIIAQCSSTDDIITAVNFARDNGLVVSVKAGGHNVSGNAVCDEGIMIDLSLLRMVNVNPEKQIAEAGGGAGQ